MQGASNFFKCIILKPLMVLSALIITILVIISLLIFVPISWLPFFLYRVLIIIIAKYKIPDARILRKVDCSLALGQEYTSNSAYISWQCILDGKLSVEKTIEDWTGLVINKVGGNGQLKFPVLQEHIHYFGGYVFMKRIQNFEAKNYIYFHQKENLNGKEETIDKLKLLEIRKKFQNTLLRKNNPLWEIMIVNNYRHNNCATDSDCSVFIFKFHHAMCDGVSGMDLVYRDLGGCTANNPNIYKSSRKLKFLTFLQQLCSPLLLVKYTFRNVYDVLYKRSRLYDINPWHVPQSRLNRKQRNNILWVAEPINKNIFRQIQSALNVSIMSILLTVIAGGMRRMMIAKNLSIPKKVRIMFPVPLPDHPHGLTNHASMAIFRIPFSINDCKKTIKSNDRLIKKSVPGSTQLLMSFTSIYTEVFPIRLKQLSAYTPFETISISCLRLPATEIELFELKVVAQNYAVNLNRTNAACLVAIMGFDEEFHISLQLENSLLNHPDEIQDLEKYILEELDFFGKNAVI